LEVKLFLPEIEVWTMTVKSDLQKTAATLESLKGSCIQMTYATEDKTAKKIFIELKTDLEKHLDYLNNRIDYLTISNELNE
jgi:bacterioferritin (cytochrome b1)